MYVHLEKSFFTDLFVPTGLITGDILIIFINCCLGEAPADPVLQSTELCHC